MLMLLIEKATVQLAIPRQKNVNSSAIDVISILMIRHAAAMLMFFFAYFRRRHALTLRFRVMPGGHGRLRYAIFT